MITQPRTFVMSDVQDEGDYLSMLPLMTPDTVNMEDYFLIKEAKGHKCYSHSKHTDYVRKTDFWEGIRPIPLNTHLNLYDHVMFFEDVHGIMVVLTAGYRDGEGEYGSNYLVWTLQVLKHEEYKPYQYHMEEIAYGKRYMRVDTVDVNSFESIELRIIADLVGEHSGTYENILGTMFDVHQNDRL